MNQSRISYSTTLKLNQRFETYDEFLRVLNIESKKNSAFGLNTIAEDKMTTHTNMSISGASITINPIVI